MQYKKQGISGKKLNVCNSGEGQHFLPDEQEIRHTAGKCLQALRGVGQVNSGLRNLPDAFFRRKDVFACVVQWLMNR